MKCVKAFLLAFCWICPFDAEGAMRPRSAEFSPDGFILAVGNPDGTLTLYDASNGEVLKELYEEMEDSFFSQVVWTPRIAFSPDDRCMVTQRGDEQAVIWSRSTGEKLGVLSGACAWSSHVFSPDSKLLAITGSRSKLRGAPIIRVYRIRDRREIIAVEGPKGCDFRHVQFTDNGAFLVCDYRPGLQAEKTFVIVWDLRQGKEHLRIEGKLRAFSPKGQMVTVSSPDGGLTVYDAASGGKRFDIGGMPEPWN